jgi:TRAP-type mannitol/chloroaromatic compound transport system substrate-binding protein
VYRVAANKMLDSTIESVLFELKEFIGNVELKGYTSEILTSKKQRKEKIIKKNKENKDVKDKKIKEKQLLISNSGINFSKYG